LAFYFHIESVYIRFPGQDAVCLGVKLGLAGSENNMLT